MSAVRSRHRPPQTTEDTKKIEQGASGRLFSLSGASTGASRRPPGINDAARFFYPAYSAMIAADLGVIWGMSDAACAGSSLCKAFTFERVLPCLSN
jgi:hypothetical protein